ncbi:hypothetical protein ACLB2K_070213 [Fragaria x ananassa]
MNNPALGFLAGFGSILGFSLWLIVQGKMSKRYPFPYSSTALMCIMGSIQNVIFALCMERVWNQWKMGWDIRLWTAAYSGIVVSGVSMVLMSWCVQKRGPLFVSSFINPLTLLMVALASSLLLGEKFSLGRLEKLNFGSKSYSNIAKIVGTVMGIGGVMLLTFYRGPVFTIWSTHIDLLRQYQNSSSVPLSPHRSSPVGFLAGLGSSFCFATWLIVQAKMSKIYPCPYSSTALMSCMGSIQSVILAICVERDWNQWKLGWDIRLWTAAYSGIVVSGLAAVMMSWCVQKRGPLFVAVFYPLTLLMVAIAGSLFLEEKFTLGRVSGGVLIVCGLYFVLWGKSKGRPTIAPHASQTSLEIDPCMYTFYCMRCNDYENVRDKLNWIVRNRKMYCFCS